MRFIGAILGFLLGVAVLLAMRLFTPSLFPKQGRIHAGFYVGKLPTGVDGTFGRRDYLAAALRSLGGALACFAVMAATIWLGSGVSAGIIDDLILGGAFFFGLLGFLCIGAAFQNGWYALFRDPMPLASEWTGDSDQDT
jgi:hypothetical protein